MTVELKQSDTPEEKERKLKSFLAYHKRKEEEKDEKRAEEILALCGSIKIDFDPVKWQREMRDEWD